MIVSIQYFQTDFGTPINITSSSLTATSVTISWTQPQSILQMDEFRVDLIRVTGTRQLCIDVEDYKSKMTTSGASTPSVDFSHLQEFSIYNVVILVIITNEYNATLTPTVEFTTKAAGKNVH